MAPEVLSRSNVNAGPGIDIWALGVMLYVMVIGELPFLGETEDEIVEQILKRKLKFKNTKPISGELKDFLNKMMTKDPEKRITMYELQTHPWMEILDEELEKSIENSKQEDEEEKKREEDEFDDLEYLSKLKIDDSKGENTLSPKQVISSSKHKKGSPRAYSPRDRKGSSSMNGSIKKAAKGKGIKKRKPKAAK